MALVERIASPGELDRAALVLLEQLLHPWLARCPRARACPVAAHRQPRATGAVLSASPAPPEPSRASRWRNSQRTPGTPRGAGRHLSRREVRSRSSRRVCRGSSRARSRCPYPAGSAAHRPRAAQATGPRARAARGRARTARRRPRPRAPWAITRSTRAPTCSVASPPGHPSRKISQSGAVWRSAWASVPRIRRSSTRPGRGRRRPRRRDRPARRSRAPAACGLTGTSANASLASAGRIRSASRRPLSVSGMSVVPVCCPLRLHAVSPCLIAKTFTPASCRLRRCRPPSNGPRRTLLPAPTSNL